MNDIHSNHSPMATRSLANALLLLCGFLAGPAIAQNSWEVNDSQANEYLKEIRDSIATDNGKAMKRLKDMSTVGAAGSRAEAALEPTEKLEKTKPSTVAKTVEDRCPRSESGDKAATELWQICQEIVRTEAAQFDYSLAIYDTFKKRKQRLDEIERDRTNLGSLDQGKLQSNSNALLALMARMDLDMRQYRLYMEAYTARLQYLRSVRDMVSNQVLKGQKGSSLGNFVSGMAGAGVLHRVLEEMKTQRNEWVPHGSGD